MPPDQNLLADPLLRTAPTLEGFKVLPPVVLYSKLGQGGMGAVYRGHHVKLDMQVAVKCLKPELSADAAYVKRFQREARLAAGISHQNVVSVKEVHESHGIHYLVMELVKGETARERVKRKGRLAEAEALAIMYGVAAGLHEAHSRGIVHRDLKPDNVLISVDGVVKLADLGLAKVAYPGEEMSLSMATSAVMGTPQYMAPEQWDTPDVKPPADIWALGATLYYLLAGQSAIAQGSVPQMARRIQEHDFPSLRALRPDVRAEVHALIETCTKRKPEERFADARSLLRALKPLVVDDDEALHDPETGQGSLRVATVTPPPKGVLLKIKEQVIGSEPRIEGVGGAGTTMAATAPPRRRVGRPATPPRRSRRAALWPAVAAAVLLGGGGYGYAAGWFTRGPTAPPGVTPKDEDKSASSDGPRRPEGDAVEKPADKPAPASTETNADNVANSRALLTRALEAMPKAEGLDGAIADLEAALRMNPQLEEAKPSLARALRRKVEKLEASDLDGAYERILRAQSWAPTDRDVGEVSARVRESLLTRLRQAITVDVPQADALCTKPELLVRGRVAPTNLKSLRAVLDARADAAAQPFPDESARDVTIEGGEFDLRLSAAQDGPAWLRLRATDKFDLRAEVLPVRVRFDTTRPELTVSSPSDGSLVPDEVVVTGTVADVTPVSVSVDGNAATMGEGGAWRCELDLAHSPNAGRKLAIVARDEGGLETRSELRLRVDAEKPALTLMHPKVQPFITRDTSVTIAGTVQDDSAVQLMLDGNQIAVGAGGVFTTDVALSRDGDYEFALAATDAVGNASEALKVVVTRATGPRAGDAIATDIGLKMIYVAPQEFVMGSPEGEAGRDSDETLHRVKITKGYWLGETEVTQGQWKAVMGTEPWKDQSYTQQGSAVAATHVSWSDAMEFCRKLTERERAAGRLPEGYRYILPTEAEWELACRAGSTTAYCYGDDASELAKYAVFGKSLEGGFANVAKEQRRANRWGFFDMHGNVWEWCLDEAGFKDGVVTTTYRDGIEDPYNTSGPLRVLRGGSWDGSARFARSAVRGCREPGYADSSLGFRPALAARSDVK